MPAAMVARKASTPRPRDWRNARGLPHQGRCGDRAREDLQQDPEPGHDPAQRIPARKPEVGRREGHAIGARSYGPIRSGQRLAKKAVYQASRAGRGRPPPPGRRGERRETPQRR